MISTAAKKCQKATRPLLYILSCVLTSINVKKALMNWENNGLNCKLKLVIQMSNLDSIHQRSEI